MSHETSEQFWQRALQVLAGGPGTLSKHPARFARAVTPSFLVKGKGCRVWDADGHSYIDTIGALGPILLGYGHPAVVRAVREQVKYGSSFSLAHPLEVEVAELLVKHIVSAEKVRFAKNGADVTQAAVRIARAVTGRKHVLCSGYHGGHDWYMATTNKDGGILPFVGRYTHQFGWNDWEKLKTLCEVYDTDIAAIIVEVPPQEWGTDEAYVERSLQILHDMAAERGAVFILDEVVTGFRYSLGGAQGRYGICPDLTCLGKALANGYPLAALVGRADLMDLFDDGHVFLSTTYGGDTVSLAAAKATIETLRDTNALTHLEAIGTELGAALQSLFIAYDLPVSVTGNFARIVLQWHDDPQGRASAQELRTLWLQETVLQGVLFGGPTFPQTCMTRKDTTAILQAAETACAMIRAALDAEAVSAALRGPVVGEVFWKRYDEPASAAA